MTVPAAQRQAIIEAAIPLLRNGVSTEVIGASFGISGRTLRSWIITDDAAMEARAEFLSGQVMASIEAMETADDVLPLARARELNKAWSWLAERRLPDMFGQKREVKHTHSLDVTQALESARAMLQSRDARVTGKLLNANVIDNPVQASSSSPSLAHVTSYTDQGGEGQSQAEGGGGASPEDDRGPGG